MIPIADSHIHIRFCRYDEIKRMLDDVAAVGVTDACLLPLPYRGAAENLAALYCKMVYSKIRLRAFGGLHLTDRYAAVAPEKQLQALLDLGIDGFKIMNAPTSRRFMGHGFDDLRYEKMFAMLEERGLPVNMHVADPEEFWNEGAQYHDPSYVSKQQLYDETFTVLKRHPGLKMSFAHFFFLSNEPEEAIRVMETYPNVRFDLTPGVEMYWNFDSRIDFWHDFFTRYSTRILFGTDSNTNKSTNQQLELLVKRKLTESRDFFTQNCYGRDFVVRGLGLSDEAAQRICHQNMIDWAGDTPRPVNEELFDDCCRRIIRDIQTQPDDPYYTAGMEWIEHFRDDPHQQIAVDFCRFALARR